jgi:hypothetical protein
MTYSIAYVDGWWYLTITLDSKVQDRTTWQSALCLLAYLGV